ncbi:MAG: hypothetical protein JSR72_04320 [Proteobacteria bacterium]|nr:hypothetical protein [Pseudomonadota bacterium]
MNEIVPPSTPAEPRSWYQQQRDRARQDREARLAATPAGQNRARVQAIAAKVLDRAEELLDRLPSTQQPAPADELSLDATRRQLAHIVRAPLLCSRKLCRRTRACCGEPRQCLAVYLPLLPPAKVAELLLDARKTRRGRARVRSAG